MDCTQGKTASSDDLGPSVLPSWDVLEGSEIGYGRVNQSLVHEREVAKMCMFTSAACDSESARQALHGNDSGTLFSCLFCERSIESSPRPR
jgi:hypothetical protein